MTNGHNSDANSEVIADVAARMRAIRRSRKALNEDAAEQRQRLRDAGIEPKAFDLVLRIADLEDEAARQNYMDSFAEAWDTLGTGGQLDWVSIIEGEASEIDEVDPPEAAA